MKIWLIEHLICAECTETEAVLVPEIKKQIHDDIIEGTLTCRNCRKRYVITDGIAILVPEKTMPIVQGPSGYNSNGMLSSYLWSHYSEFFNGPDATGAYNKWASILKPKDGWAVDIGCAVGRLSFELSRSHNRVIGLDTSYSFIKEARNLLAQQQVTFDMIIEGRITENRSCLLNPDYQFGNIEFIVADAMAMPFRTERFTTATSVNILEKVPDPIQHLREANRVMTSKDAMFLFSDPFSWDEEASSPDLWLGGRNSGPYQGRGIDNICRLLEGDEKIFSPAFGILEKGEVQWKIRKTAHLWEHITSQFVMAERI